MKKKPSSPDSSLDGLRGQIDQLDKQLLQLLNERGRFVQKIGAIKQKSGQAIFVPDREQRLLDRLKQNNAGPFPNSSLQDVFREIMHACRTLQRPLRIAFFGLEATNTHLAALKHFGRSSSYIPCKTISDVFEEVEKDNADYGVVPIENSTEGIVTHTLDMFVHSDLRICAELELPIGHYLLGHQSAYKKGRGIKVVYSHYQALAQCRKWLETNLPHARIHEAPSTAHAARLAQSQKQAVAIASKLAGEIYGLDTLAEHIEDETKNSTRFLVIGANDTQPSGKDKTSILFSIKDRVGALYDTLYSFKQYGLNMTKIESRPTKKRLWEYLFFVDFLGHRSETRVQQALKRLEKSCVFVKILGSYPRRDS